MSDLAPIRVSFTGLKPGDRPVLNVHYAIDHLTPPQVQSLERHLNDMLLVEAVKEAKEQP